MSSYTSGGIQYPELPVNIQGLPQEITSDMRGRPIPTKTSQTFIMAQTQNVAGGSSTQIIVPYSMVYMNECYLKFNVSCIHTGDGADIANSFRLKGPASTGSACINQVVYQIGAQTIDVMNNYDEMSSMFEYHQTSPGFVAQDLSIASGAGQTWQGANPHVPGSITQFQVCVPMGGLLSKTVPLALFGSQNLVINILFNQYTRIFANVVANSTITGASFSNIQLVYQSIQCESDFINAQLQEIAAGKTFVHPFVSNLCQAYTSIAGQTTIPLAPNLKSLRCVCLSQVLSADLTNTLLANRRFSSYTGNPLSNILLYVDGNQVSFPLLQNGVIDIPSTFLESTRAISKLFDTQVIECSDAATYLTQGFFVGINLRKYHNDSMLMTGTKCATLQLYFNSTNANYTHFIHLFYDKLLLISANGIHVDF